MKNRQANITILIPVYNGAKNIKEAIDSILNQTFKDFELLIINDGLTDNTEEIIKSYKDERIKYHYHSNRGVLSKKTEGCPNAILEYMRAGLPIVGTDIPGIRKIIHESNKDFLFPTGHIDQCAKELDEMINYPHLRIHIGSLNKNHVNKNFTELKMNNAYRTI